jgi:hypothetical protein
MAQKQPGSLAATALLLLLLLLLVPAELPACGLTRLK